jgi:hypothetical protein
VDVPGITAMGDGMSRGAGMELLDRLDELLGHALGPVL